MLRRTEHVGVARQKPSVSCLPLKDACSAWARLVQLVQNEKMKFLGMNLQLVWLLFENLDIPFQGLATIARRS